MSENVLNPFKKCPDPIVLPPQTNDTPERVQCTFIFCRYVHNKQTILISSYIAIAKNIFWRPNRLVILEKMSVDFFKYEVHAGSFVSTLVCLLQTDKKKF